MSQGILKLTYLPFTLSQWYTVADNVTINSNRQTTHNINISKPGWVPIGCLNYSIWNASSSGKYSGDCNMNALYINSNNTVTAVVHNWGTNTAKIAFGMRVFYVREGLCQVER